MSQKLSINVKQFSTYTEDIFVFHGINSSTSPLKPQSWKHYGPGDLLTCSFGFEIKNAILMKIQKNTNIIQVVKIPFRNNSEIVQFSVLSPAMSCKFIKLDVNSIPILKRFQIVFTNDNDFQGIVRILQQLQVVMKNAKLRKPSNQISMTQPSYSNYEVDHFKNIQNAMAQSTKNSNLNHSSLRNTVSKNQSIFRKPTHGAIYGYSAVPNTQVQEQNQSTQILETQEVDYDFDDNDRSYSIPKFSDCFNKTSDNEIRVHISKQFPDSQLTRMGIPEVGNMAATKDIFNKNQAIHFPYSSQPQNLVTVSDHSHENHLIENFENSNESLKKNKADYLINPIAKINEEVVTTPSFETRNGCKTSGQMSVLQNATTTTNAKPVIIEKVETKNLELPEVEKVHTTKNSTDIPTNVNNNHETGMVCDERQRHNESIKKPKKYQLSRRKLKQKLNDKHFMDWVC